MRSPQRASRHGRRGRGPVALVRMPCPSGRSRSGPRLRATTARSPRRAPCLPRAPRPGVDHPRARPALAGQHGLAGQGGAEDEGTRWRACARLPRRALPRRRRRGGGGDRRRPGRRRVPPRAPAARRIAGYGVSIAVRTMRPALVRTSPLVPATPWGRAHFVTIVRVMRPCARRRARRTARAARGWRPRWPPQSPRGRSGALVVLVLVLAVEVEGHDLLAALVLGHGGASGEARRERRRPAWWSPSMSHFTSPQAQREDRPPCTTGDRAG
jgi:hypothetical protein